MSTRRPKRIRIWANGYDGPALNLDRWSLDGVRLRGGKGDQERLVLTFMEQLLARRRRWWTYLPNYRVWMAACLIVVAVIVIGAFTNLLPLRWLAPLLLAMSALAGLTYFSLRTELGFGSVLHLDHSHATTSFWSRHAEKLLYTVLGAAIGAAAKPLVEHFLK